MLLQNSGIDFFSSCEFPGSFLTFNVCENIGSILKDRVEERRANYDGVRSLTHLRIVVIEVLEDRELDY